jgi:hypothetical protein
MKKFLTLTAAVAIAISGVSWFLLPKLRQSRPDLYRRIASFVEVSVSKTEETVSKAQGAALQAKAQLSQVAEKTVEKSGDIAESLKTTFFAGSTEQSAQKPQESAPAAAEPPIDAAPAAAAPDPRAAKNADPGLPWGVVATNSACYDKSVTRLGVLPGGTPVEVVSRKRLPANELIECKVLKNGFWQERTVWFFDSDLVLFDSVTYAETPRETRDALLDYFTAWGEYEKEKTALIERMRPRNPHESAYRKAKAEHDALAKEIAETMERVRYSDTHTLPGGAKERGDLLKKANELRVRQKADAVRFEPVKERYEQWEREHASVFKPDDLPSTPKMIEDKATMEKLRPIVEKIVPSLF